MKNHSQIQFPDQGSAPKKAYNSPRMEPQGNANEIVRSGADGSFQEACENFYNLSGAC